MSELRITDTNSANDKGLAKSQFPRWQPAGFLEGSKDQHPVAEFMEEIKRLAEICRAVPLQTFGRHVVGNDDAILKRGAEEFREFAGMKDIKIGDLQHRTDADSR